MDQQQFDAIIELIKFGAPAFANNLCQSLVNLVETNKTLAKQLEEAKTKLAEKEKLEAAAVKKTTK